MQFVRNIVFIYQSRTVRGQHEEHHHVNTVGFMDETSNIIFTGLDDGVIQVIQSWYISSCSETK